MHNFHIRETTGMNSKITSYTKLSTSASQACQKTGATHGRRSHVFSLGLMMLSAGVLTCGCQPKSAPDSASRPAAAEAPTHPIVKSVALSTQVQLSDFTGSVHSELESTLAARISGRVARVLVHEGDRIHRGQTLIELDANDLDSAVAQAGAALRSANVNFDTARTAERMETSLSAARISEARARVAQSEAGLKSATAKLELVMAGPRRQERDQVAQAVVQAQSGLSLAESNLKRMEVLFKEGAVAAQQYDQTKTQYQIAKAQFEMAVQAKSAADEGSRPEEVRAAKEAVNQAAASVREANAGLESAKAAALQTEVHKQEIEGAKAQIGQSRAGVSMARTTREFALIAAPFDGIITHRFVDPGTMAGPGVPLLQIEGGALRLNAVIPESALKAVHVGSQLPVLIDALGNKQATGAVVEISPQGDETSHSFMIKVQLPTGSGASSGMFGRAAVATGTETVLLAPVCAIWESEGLHYLYALDKSHHARLRLVTTGKPRGDSVPVLSGLSPGEQIIVSDHTGIADGSLVSGE